MPTSPLASFIDQIATWAEQAIEQGRSPFRKVETNVPLLTAEGELHAPLVFWINRDSCMAGGVLLFPDLGAPSPPAEGQQLAEALGVKHFVEWRDQQIHFWEVTPAAPQLIDTLALSQTSAEQVAAFRTLLDQTLDKLKYLSVIASIPPEQLSESYLANLCRTAVQDTLPLLEAENRILLVGGSRTSRDWPMTKAYLTVIRLLALTCLDLLPTAVQPEGLEKALRFAVAEIPQPLRKRLEFKDQDLPLPNPVAVRFHHLLRRLQQLGMPGTLQRACGALTLLLSRDAGHLSGVNWPPALSHVEAVTGDLSVNTVTPPTSSCGNAEISAPPLLAARTLIRQLQGWPQPQHLGHDLFTLHLPEPPQTVDALLFRDERPDKEQRVLSDAGLRISWPSRRFNFLPSAPVWLFEAVHLLGLCRPNGSLSLKLPAEWLENSWGELLWDLVRQDFSLQQLTIVEDRWALLDLVKSEEETLTLLIGGTVQQVAWQRLKQLSRSQFLTRLCLPEAWRLLLENGELRVYQHQDEFANCMKAVEFFFHHPPGQTLERLHNLDLMQLQGPSLAGVMVSYGLPAPTEEALERLETLLEIRHNVQPMTADDLHEHFCRLGDSYQLLPDIPLEGCLQQRQETRRGKLPRSLAIELADEVFSDGIPVFPEHYLYDYFKPELEEFRWEGALQLGEEFFGTLTLQGATAGRFEITGRPRAAGVLLAAATGHQKLNYPVDPQICEAILNRYLGDLQRLRQKLIELTHARIDQARQAENLIRKIWNSRALPPWEQVEQVLALFPELFHVK